MDLSHITQDTPAMMPPHGMTSNFETPHSTSGGIYATLILSIVISTVFVWTRLYTRYFVIKLYGWEDYTSLVAWALLIGYLAVGFVLITHGAGVHEWNIRWVRLIPFLRLANVMEIYYNPLIFITKLSILLQLKRIFSQNQRGKTFWYIQFLIWGNFLFYFSIMMASILRCRPRAKIWDPVVEGHCVDMAAAYMLSAVINVVSDFSILIFPIVRVWKLQISRNRRIGVCAIFAAGGLACFSSIYRLIQHIGFRHNQDVTYRMMQVASWSIAEITSGIVCGCLPSMPKFFHHCAPKIKNKFVGIFAGDGGSKQKPPRISWPTAAGADADAEAAAATDESFDFQKFEPPTPSDEENLALRSDDVHSTNSQNLNN